MIIHQNADNTPGTHVLALFDHEEGDLLGVWGPYASEAEATAARDELNDWPLDGRWEAVALKRYIPATLRPGLTLRSTDSTFPSVSTHNTAPGSSMYWNSGGNVQHE